MLPVGNPSSIVFCRKNAERITQYKKYEKELNFENISFLVQADEIILRRFEWQNPTIALCICK
jgi:hypothetical protein